MLVHGSVVGGRATWSPTVGALAGRFDLEVVDRPGFPPNPPVDRVDFEAHAVLIADGSRPGDHLVGHSYGGVVCLLAAAARPERLRSLTVIEPPCTRVALGDAAADAFAAEALEWWTNGPTDDPDAFLRGFLHTVGSGFEPPTPLPPALEQGARTLIVERGPWEAEIPLDALAATSFPKLVVSGAHHAAFDVICDVLERELPAERAVLPGFGHGIPRHPEFPAVLARFLERSEP